MPIWFLILSLFEKNKKKSQSLIFATSSSSLVVQSQLKSFHLPVEMYGDRGNKIRKLIIFPSFDQHKQNTCYDYLLQPYKNVLISYTCEDYWAQAFNDRGSTRIYVEMIENWVHYNLPGALTQAFNHVSGNIQCTLFL